MLPVPQTYNGMSSACLRVQAESLAGKIDARQCPVTAWAVRNTVGQEDGKANLMFLKGKSRGRIDPVIAITIGMAHWLRFAPVNLKRPSRVPRVWTPAGWQSDEATA